MSAGSKTETEGKPSDSAGASVAWDRKADMTSKIEKMPRIFWLTSRKIQRREHHEESPSQIYHDSVQALLSSGNRRLPHYLNFECVLRALEEALTVKEALPNPTITSSTIWVPPFFSRLSCARS